MGEVKVKEEEEDERLRWRRIRSPDIGMTFQICQISWHFLISLPLLIFKFLGTISFFLSFSFFLSSFLLVLLWPSSSSARPTFSQFQSLKIRRLVFSSFVWIMCISGFWSSRFVKLVKKVGWVPSKTAALPDRIFIDKKNTLENVGLKT